MFDIFAKLLSSIASFLFPLFASYKALKTSDPAQLTPWLMYWVVLACALLVESWTEWILVWIPFYAYLRLLFLLYLVLPQTQGARILYQTYIHPYLEDNETQIEDFIASAHERLRAAGIAYLKHAIELLRTHVFGLPPGEPDAAPAAAAASGEPPQSYTQSLLARFSLPAARWAASNTSTSASAGTDFYGLLAGAVSAMAAEPATRGNAGGAGVAGSDLSASGTLIPPNIREGDRASFIATQRERLSTLLGALDREAAQLQARRPGSLGLDGDGAADADAGTPAAASSGLAKSRSEADFEKIDAESGAEELDGEGARRRRTPAAAAGGSWMPWGWGAGGAGADAQEGSSASGVEK